MMILRHSPTSPYVRKVRMVAHETGLAGRIELVPTDVWAADTTIFTDNPLGKVPALVTEDGLVLFDSPVICEYLDGLHDGTKLFPAPGPGRWRALRQQAIADGVLDAAILRRLEGQRPEPQRSTAWMERQRAAVARALDVLEREVAEFEGAPTIGTIAILAALGYLDFRFGHEDWRKGRPLLAAWFADRAQRPSFQTTAPPAS